MIYCIQVFTGDEEKVVKRLKDLTKDDEAITDIYAPKKMTLKKYKGKWHKEYFLPFPSYVFIESNDINKIYPYLYNVRGLTKLLGVDKKNKYVSNLFPDEERLILGLMGKNHTIDLSDIEVLDNKDIRILDGPLLGLTGKVIKTDLHKRRVTVLIPLMGREIETTLGINIVESLNKEEVIQKNKEKENKYKEELESNIKEDLKDFNIN